MSSRPDLPLPGRLVPLGSRLSPGGPRGVPGTFAAKGDTGDIGKAFTLTVIDAFSVPAVGATVAVTVQDASWVIPGQIIYVSAAGLNGAAGDLEVVNATVDPSQQFWHLTLRNPVPPGRGPRGPMGGAPFYGVALLASDANPSRYTVAVGEGFTPDPGYGVEPGTTVFVQIPQRNSFTAYLNVNNTGDFPIQNRSRQNLNMANLVAGDMIGVTFDGGAWRLFTQ